MPILCDTCINEVCQATKMPCDAMEAELQSLEVDKPRNHVPMPDHETLATQARPIPATAPDRYDYDKLRSLVRQAMQDTKMKDPKNPTTNIAASNHIKNQRCAIFAAFLRCFTLTELAKILRQSKSTVEDQLNRTVQQCGNILLSNAGLPPNKKGGRSAAKFKDAFIRGTYK